MDKNNNQLAIVTGAGSGIGRALTIELAIKHNIEVLAVGRTIENLNETAELAGKKVITVVADVSTEEGRLQILKVTNGKSVKFLVHNAAILEPVVSLKDMKLTDWRKHQQINVEGPLFLTQLLLPQLNNGRILQISSGAAHHAYAGWGAYCTSKAAMHMIYQVLKKELQNTSVQIGSVRPGVVNTPMQNKVRAVTDEVFPQRKKFVELKENNQLLPPEKVAAFLCYLLFETDDASFSEKEWDIREQ